ncbi:M20/M25/M40 family metallo-hydrolase [Gemmata sp. JC673]|uniref:M20/M25/M40 family metallo-hydrolase n=1 Tax=Gemmata algarum TaxID=2975278 RepID=A0ABU5F3V4_9BACT|nr:M20/M25/M40 family metallo-hydrolase [Gemmata algarum]MDY3562010.1 M20/M25/M40 family metallo-hydrolase [Gemmata algarum]
MPAAAPAFALDTAAAVERLLRFLSVNAITGHEGPIGKELAAALQEVGVPAKAITFDDAHTRIPEPTPIGNLIVKLPGTGKKGAKPILFMTHMDTVPLCAGAKPKIAGKRIVNELEGTTALGGDNRTGCAVLVTLAAELIKQNLPHPPITMLFTVREESGLFGAKHLNPADLGGSAVGFNFDGRSAADVIVGAIGADRWFVDIRGKAAHAGVAPEKGISATMVLALAMAEVYEGGWFGKVTKDGREGTSNVGLVGTADGKSAGDATNVVTDFVHVKGESRSHDAKFVREITAAYKTAFTNAAAKVKDHEGRAAKVKFTSRLDYVPFRLKSDAPVVKLAEVAIQKIGRTPNLRTTNGGLDANWMVKHGIPTVTFGAGQNEIHTVKEFVDLREFESACQLALALATAE